ncbi:MULTISPECIES: GNAT family N-acetyltransferase [Streptomyces]|uniref:GNAT family N-acetyltransferase n=2 Tax=Streptomyces TaxID=1883 RepID=UPI001673F020|nr:MULTISPECIES: GNAT family N-acetyltransferase [Streptomyces]MBD3577659.1 GNAT family N-acetyltransferase [Streptomyces sp. KD18]
MKPLPTLSAPQILTGRLRLRRAHDADTGGLVELRTDPEVRAHLGGPQPRAAVEGYFAAYGVGAFADKPGAYVIADRSTDRCLGVLVLDRRSAELPGHVDRAGGELELSYVLRRTDWGAGVAFEAASAALRAAAEELPDQPVLVVTQAANARAVSPAVRLGFRAAASFEAYGAEQLLAVADLHAFEAPPPLRQPRLTGRSLST